MYQTRDRAIKHNLLVPFVRLVQQNSLYRVGLTTGSHCNSVIIKDDTKIVYENSVFEGKFCNNPWRNIFIITSIML